MKIRSRFIRKLDEPLGQNSSILSPHAFSSDPQFLSGRGSGIMVEFLGGSYLKATASKRD